MKKFMVQVTVAIALISFVVSTPIHLVQELDQHRDGSVLKMTEKSLRSECRVQKRVFAHTNTTTTTINGGDKPDGDGLYRLTFYHVNDVHAHLDEFRPSGSSASCLDPTKDCVGGYPRIKTVLDQSQREHSIVLNAGDEFQGTLFYKLFKGAKISQVLNQVGFDAMTLGNHEFDDGEALLAGFLDDLNFPVISSNIHSSNDQLAESLNPYMIFTGHGVALLALTTETTPTISRPSNLTSFEDPIFAARRTVKHIQDCHPGINRIVALTHIGYEQDILLAKNTSGISLIIGGHSHTLLGNMTGSSGPYPTVVKNLDGKDVYVVTSYRWGEYLGYINVVFDRKGQIVKYDGGPIHLTNSIAEDGDLKIQITKWSEAFVPYQRTVLGTTKTPLVQTTCQITECTLGDFSADAMEDYRPGSTVGAFLNSGGIRTQIDAGNITMRDALECFPFGNSLVELELTGEMLWDIFEGIVSGMNVENKRKITSFVQVSRSIKFTYNPRNAIGSRLITLSIGHKPVKLGNRYGITTLDYVAAGGDNFLGPLTNYTTLDGMDEVWANYVKAKSPISYSLQGRIGTTTERIPRKEGGKAVKYDD